jgi:DNA-binding winged helix-turn-helix (wHTH) protein/Flp pilus assembly protein TadD
VTPGARFVFAPFELATTRPRLTCAGEPVALSDRQLEVLLLLVARAGQIVAKDDLIEAGWKDVAVGDNSLEQAISSLRRLLGAHAPDVPFIETVPRRGYRFVAGVTRTAPRETDAGLEALLAPHRAVVEGRLAIESFEADQVPHARRVFEGALASAPEYAPAHIGLANACVMQYEMTRADPAPDGASLDLAARHAREACRLDPASSEAWATLGFVLERAGARLDALAAAKRAVALEPDNWRHHFRLAYIGWGEERLRSAHRTLAILPAFPLAHWLAATVYVARQVPGEAERELLAGLGALALSSEGGPRFSGLALHWLLGLLHLARGDDERALEEFRLELAIESTGHLYARECTGNTWYAIGAMRLRQGRRDEAALAFDEALRRVPLHPMAALGKRAALAPAPLVVTPAPTGIELPGGSIPQASDVDSALVRAVHLSLRGADVEAAAIVEWALAGAPTSPSGWLLPVEPLLNVSARPAIWANALATLRNRAA